MTKTDETKKDTSPIVTISLINYDPALRDEYSKKFMAPLIEGDLQRRQLVKTIQNQHFNK